jgi:putative aldouronate transport system substrate-binding protein
MKGVLILRRFRKTFFTTISLLLTSTLLLAACSSGTSTQTQTPGSAAPKGTDSPQTTTAPNSGGSPNLGEKPLDFTIYAHYDKSIMPPWGADSASKWIKDNKKVNITVINGNNAAQAKLNNMIASKTLPDVIWMDRNADLKKLIDNELLVPLDDYINKYPNFKKWAKESLDLLRSEDGKVYQLPNWYTTQPMGNAGYVVNKKYYQELGSPKLETTDDLYNYLKAVKAKYGDAVVPFEPGIDMQGGHVLYTAFKENNDPKTIVNRVVPDYEKNVLTSLFKDPTYRESVQYLNKLFSEKLMSQDAFTQTSDMVKEKVLNGKVAVYASSSPTENASLGHDALRKKDPSHPGYFMIWPIRKEGLDKNKIFPGSYTSLGWNVAVITKNAKDPEAIFAFLDWYTGEEGQRIANWGPEGQWWQGTDAQGGPIYTKRFFEEKEAVSKFTADTSNLIFNGNTVFVDSAKQRNELTLPEDQQKWETQWQNKITWKTQINANQYLYLDSIPSDSAEGIANKRIQQIWKEAQAKAIQAKNPDDVLKILDQAEADSMNAGYEKVLKWQTAKWQENLKKLKTK